MPDNQFSVAVPNLLQAILTGEQAYDSGKQDRTRKEAADLYAQGDTQNALAKLLAGGDTKSITALGQYQNGANSVYGTPIYGVGPDGKPAIGSFDKQGKFRPIDTGAFEVTPGVKTIDTPQGVYVVGSKSGQPIPLSAPQGMPPAQNGMPGVPPPQAQNPTATTPQSQPQGAPLTPRPVQTQSFYPKDYLKAEADKKVGAETGQKISDMGHAKSSLDTTISNLDRMELQANELLAHPGLGRITGMTGMLPNVPGYPGADAQAKLDTLRAQSGFSTLQSMRDASKTGGALGSVTEGEHKLLQGYLAELTTAQTEKQFKDALAKIKTFTQGAKDRLREAYNTDYAGIERPQQQNLPAAGPAKVALPKIGEMRDGYRYKGGNPADEASWVKSR